MLKVIVKENGADVKDRFLYRGFDMLWAGAELRI